MKKFVYICFEKDDNCGKIKKFLKKKTLFLRHEKVENIEISGQKGIKIVLPFNKNEEDLEKKVRFLKKVEKKYDNFKDYFVALEYKPNSFLYDFCKGKCFSAFFADTIIKSIYGESLNNDTIKITVIDDGGICTKLLLWCISKLPVEIILVTDDRDSAENMLSEIYENTGLCIIPLYSINNSLIENSDLCINCSETFKDVHFLKKNGILIDISDRNFQEFKNERPDVKIIKIEDFIFDENILNRSLLEAVCLCKYDKFCDCILERADFKEFWDIHDILNVNFSNKFIES